MLLLFCIKQFKKRLIFEMLFMFCGKQLKKRLIFEMLCGIILVYYKKGAFLLYKSLRSLSYQGNDLYKDEYKKRFEALETVKIDFDINGRQAFFLQNFEAMSAAYTLAKTDKRIFALCEKLPGIALSQYTKKCLINEIVLTNGIEGVNSSRKEIGDILSSLEKKSKAKGKEMRFHGLVKKYLKLSEKEFPMVNTCEDIRKIYDEICLEEVVGEDVANKPDGILFRKDSVSVFSATQKMIHTGLYPESKIIDATEKALHFLNDESVINLFRICIFHYLIEYIHPFYDGNGRLGRFILSNGISTEFSPLLSFRISRTIKEDINAYYKAFAVCNDRRNLGDLTPFLLMMLTMILRSAEDLEQSLTDKFSMWKLCESSVVSVADSMDMKRLYSLLVQAALFSEDGISMQELEQNLQMSRYSINKLLEAVPEKFVSVQKKGNIKHFMMKKEVLDDILLENVSV